MLIKRLNGTKLSEDIAMIFMQILDKLILNSGDSEISQDLIKSFIKSDFNKNFQTLLQEKRLKSRWNS